MYVTTLQLPSPSAHTPTVSSNWPPRESLPPKMWLGYVGNVSTWWTSTTSATRSHILSPSQRILAATARVKWATSSPSTSSRSSQVVHTLARYRQDLLHVEAAALRRVAPASPSHLPARRWPWPWPMSRRSCVTQQQTAGTGSSYRGEWTGKRTLTGCGMNMLLDLEVRLEIIGWVFRASILCVLR